MIKALSAKLDEIETAALVSYAYISYDLDQYSSAIETHICVSIAL